MFCPDTVHTYEYLAAEKKALYAEYYAAQRDMREALAVKTNIDHLLGLTAPGMDKEQAR